MSLFWFYFKLGYHHVMDWRAYDHLLFLIVLTVGYTFYNWKKVAGLVTVFTAGHTLSLTLSVYNWVTINAAWVEFLIPLTIFITALFNIFTAGRGPQKEKFGLIFFAALFFGLIHGLGFFNYFKSIVAVEEDKFLPLLEFALGIETAQVVIVLLVLILNFIFQSVFRCNKRDWIIVVSAIVTGVALTMLSASYPY